MDAKSRLERNRKIARDWRAGRKNAEIARRNAVSLATVKRVIAAFRAPDAAARRELGDIWTRTYASEKAKGRLIKEGYLMGYCARAAEDNHGYNGPFIAPPDPFALDDAAAPDRLRMWMKTR